MKTMPLNPPEDVIHRAAWVGENLNRRDMFANNHQLYWGVVEQIYRAIYNDLPEQANTSHE